MAREETRSRHPRPSRPTRRRRRWRSRILITLVVLVLALGALVVFAPTIAGAVAPGPLAGAINARIPGEVDLDGVSLSWRGPQRVRSARLHDIGGEQIADVSIEADTSLLELIRGSRDLGTVVLAGEADVVRHGDGVTNVERALGLDRQRGPGREDDGPPAQLPESLEAKLRIDELRATWTDEQAGTEAAAVLTGTGAFATGRGASFDLAAEVHSGPGGAAREGQQAGRVQLAGTVTDLTDAQQRLAAEQAVVEATLEAADVPSRLIDSIGALDGQVARALGERVSVSASVRGQLHDAQADVQLSSATGDARLALRRDGQEVALREPGVIEVRGPALLESWPQLREVIGASGQLELLEAPRVTLEITSASARLPAEGAGFDLGAVALEAQVRASPAAARLAALEEGGQPVELRTKPVSVQLVASPLADGVRAEGSAGATVDGQDAGELRFTVDANPIGPDGELRDFARPGDVEARGQIALTGFETRIAQPYVERFGVQLAEDLGPQVEIVARASPGEGGATAVAARLRSENVNADVAAALTGEMVSLTGNGLSVRVRQAGPLASRLLTGAGVTLESAEQVNVHLAEGRATMGTLQGDLRELAGSVQVQVGPMRGAAQVAEQQRQFQTRPFTMRLQTDGSLAKGASVELQGGVAVDGQEAGEIRLTASAGDLLDQLGRLQMELPQTLTASGTVRGFSTALAQPLVEASGVVLPEDIGPRVDVQFDASPRRDDDVALQLAASSDKADVAATAVWNGRRVFLTGEGARAELRDPGPLLARLAPPDAPLTPQPGGSVQVVIPQLSAPLAGGLDLQRITGNAVVTIEGLSAQSRTGEPVRADRMVVRYRAASPSAARLELNGQLAHGEAPFSIQGAFNFAPPLPPAAGGEDGVGAGAGDEGAGGPAPSWAERLVAMRPAGDLTLADLPPSLISILAPAAEDEPGAAGDPEAGAEADSAEPIDLASLLEQMTEGPLTVTLGAVARGEDGRSSVQIDVMAKGGPTEIAVAGHLERNAVRLDSATIDARLEPGLIAALAPESPARLTDPAPVRLTAAPFAIPLTETGGLDLAAVEQIAIELTTPGQVLVAGLTAGGEGEEPARELPPVGARGLSMRVTAPGAALAAAGEIGVRGETEIVTGGDRVVAQAQFTGTAQTSGGRLSGDPSVAATLRSVDAAFLDELAGEPHLISGAVGARIGELTVEAEGRLGATPEDPAFDVRRALLGVQSPRLQSSGPIRLHREGGALTLDEPVELQWRAVPGWTNRFVAQAPQEAGPPPLHAARFSAPADFVVRLDQFAIGPPGALLAPDVFALQAAVSAQRVGLMTGAGEDVSFTDVAITATGGETPGRVAWELQATQVGAGEEGRIRAVGELTSLADAEGRLTTDQAALTLDLEAPSLRSAAVDTVIRQGGLIHAMMGETMSISAHIERFSSAGGTLQASAESPRAALALEGRVEEGALVVTGPARLVTLREVTPELGDMIAPSLPQIARFQKRPEDEPGYVDQQELRFPLDGDMSKLNGQITIALGQAQFQTSSAFSRLLKKVQAESEAMVGRRLDPLVLTMTDGVISYDRYTIPLGEFNLEASGTINLPDERLDVVTWIPIGALTDEAAGMFNTGLGSLLGRAVPEFERLTMVPWRTRGRFGDTQTLPAPGLFAENVGSRLLRPDRIIRDVFSDYLPGRSDKDTPQQDPPKEPQQEPQPAPAGGGGG